MSLFIAFEGLDGAGSSTQAKLLEEWFKNKGNVVVLTKEPTHTLIGGLIKSALKKEWKTSPTALQLLFCADRGHHLFYEIEPALDAGKVVITDRYLFSTIAFGAINSNKNDKDWLTCLNSKFRIPDLTFYIDVPPEVCLQRIKRNRFSTELFEEKSKLSQVRENYKSFKNNFDNFFEIDGTKKIEEIHSDIINIVENHLKSNKTNLQKFL